MDGYNPDSKEIMGQSEELEARKLSETLLLQWRGEYKNLEIVLKEAKEDVRRRRDILVNYLKSNAREVSDSNSYLSHPLDKREHLDIERMYRQSWEWVWKIERRMHELRKREGEELARIARLERATRRTNQATTQRGNKRPRLRGKGNKTQPDQNRNN